MIFCRIGNDKKLEDDTMEIMKNIRKAEVVKLKEEVSYQDGQVVSKTLVQKQRS